MSVSNRPNMETFLADAAISKGMACKGGTDASHVAKGSANTSRTIGPAQNAATAAEDAVEVALPGGGGKFLLGETVVFGSYLVSHTDGTWVKANAAGDHVGGYALEGGVAGDLINGQVVCFEAYDAEA